MSYIGKTPTVGNFIKLDDITTSSTNSYTLQHNSVNFSPESANHMLVSLNGVIQAQTQLSQYQAQQLLFYHHQELYHLQIALTSSWYMEMF